MLKLLEGTVCEVEISRNATHSFLSPKVKIDTSNILFICGGAFPDVEDIIKKRMGSKKSSIGFGSNVSEEENIQDVLLNVKVEDLRKFGMIPEFLGRLPIVVPFQDMTEEMLMRILVEPKNSILKQYQRLMEIDNSELEFDKEALEVIVKRAMDNKTGARGLKSIMEDIMEEIMFEIPSKGHCTIVKVTKAYVLGMEKYFCV